MQATASMEHILCISETRTQHDWRHAKVFKDQRTTGRCSEAEHRGKEISTRSRHTSLLGKAGDAWSTSDVLVQPQPDVGIGNVAVCQLILLNSTPAIVALGAMRQGGPGHVILSTRYHATAAPTSSRSYTSRVLYAMENHVVA